MANTLTAPQRKAIERLLSIGIENFPRKPLDSSGLDGDVKGVIFTGISSTVLASLVDKQMITCAHVFLRGHVSDDLAVTDAARAEV